MEGNTSLRVTVFETERMIRDLLLTTLVSGGVQVLRTYDEADSFLQNLASDRPDVAVADLGAQIEGALPFIREAHEKHPGIPMVVISARAAPDAESCYREGAAAWLDMSTSSSDELVRAVREVSNGVRLFPLTLTPSTLRAEPARKSSPLLDKLSLRERQVLTYIGDGSDNLKISAHLGITERTVKSHVTNLYRKTNAENRTQLAILARELGLRPAIERQQTTTASP